MRRSEDPLLTSERQTLRQLCQHLNLGCTADVDRIVQLNQRKFTWIRAENVGDITDHKLPVGTRTYLSVSNKGSFRRPK